MKANILLSRRSDLDELRGELSRDLGSGGRDECLDTLVIVDVLKLAVHLYNGSRATVVLLLV